MGIIQFERFLKVIMFYKLKLEKAIIKWRQMRINLILFAQKKAELEQKVLEEQYSQLKVPEKLLLTSPLFQYAFEGLIKRVKFLYEYVNLNLEAFESV